LDLGCKLLNFKPENKFVNLHSKLDEMIDKIKEYIGEAQAFSTQDATELEASVKLKESKTFSG
jgi:hypothetical protein